MAKEAGSIRWKSAVWAGVIAGPVFPAHIVFGVVAVWSYEALAVRTVKSPTSAATV